MDKPSERTRRFMTVRAMRAAAHAVSHSKTAVVPRTINIPFCLDIDPVPSDSTEAITEMQGKR